MTQQLDDEFDKRIAVKFVPRKARGEAIEVRPPWWPRSQDEFWYEEEATLP